MIRLSSSWSWPRVLLLALTLPVGLDANGAERVADAEVRPLVEAALARHPSLQEASERTAAAEARVPQAAALPDPEVSLLVESAGGRPQLGRDGEESTLGVMARQMIPFPGKQRLAGQMAAAEAAATWFQRHRAALTLETRIRRAYADLLLARGLREVIAEQRQTWREMEAATRARYSAGMGAQQDVLRAQAEISRLEPMTYHEEGNEAMALATLNELTARPPGTELPTPRGLPELVQTGAAAIPLPPLAAVLDAADAGSPELQALRAMVGGARTGTALARRNRAPDFVAAASYRNRGSMAGMWELELGLVVPLWSRRKQGQAVVEAQAGLRAMEAGLETARLAVRSATERAYAELAAAIREAAPYATGVLVQDRLAVEASLANYQAGKVPFVTVLEAIDALYKDRRSYLEILAHVLWHDADLWAFAPEGSAMTTSMPGWSGAE